MDSYGWNSLLSYSTSRGVILVKLIRLEIVEKWELWFS